MIPVEFIYPGIPTAELVKMIRELNADRGYEWNPALHPRDRVGRWAEKSGGGRWTGGPGMFEPWPKPSFTGTFFGWDSPVVYVDDNPVMESVDGQKGLFWRAFYMEDGRLLMWFPGAGGPHHSEIETRYVADHPETMGRDPFADAAYVSGVGIPRRWMDVEVVGPGFDESFTATREFYEKIMRLVQRRRKDFEFAESLVPQTYYDEDAERDFASIAWDAKLHPRWPKGTPKGGKFMTKSEIASALRRTLGLDGRTGRKAEGAVPGEGRRRPVVRFAQTTDYERFNEALGRNALPQFLTRHTPEELARDRVYLSGDGESGYAISPDGDLQNVFRNPDGKPGAGREAVHQAVLRGAVMLDAFDGYLPGMYSDEGFRVVGRMKWNDDYAPEGWDYATHGRPDVVFMAYNPPEGTEVKFFTDWDEAKAYSREVARPYGRLDPLEGGEAKKGDLVPSREVTVDDMPADYMEKVEAKYAKVDRTLEEVRQNLRDVFATSVADEQSVEEGRVWYQEAHDWAQGIADEYGVPIEEVAIVASISSPGQEWEMNKRVAEALYETHRLYPEETNSGYLPKLAQSEFNLGVGKAGYKRMAEGARVVLGQVDAEDAVNGPKTRSFVNAILYPDNDLDVVVDSHVLNMSYGGMREGAAGVLVIPEKQPGYPKGWRAQTPKGVPWVAVDDPGLVGSPGVSRGGKEEDIKQSWGVLPFVADEIRQLVAEWNAEHPDEPPLLPLQAQAIMWVWWKRRHPSIASKLATEAASKATAAYYGVEWQSKAQLAKARTAAKAAKAAV